MSLLDDAPPTSGSKPPPSAPSGSPPPPADKGAPPPKTPPTGGDAPPPTANDGAWRAQLAGDDTDAIQQLSRFKSPGDFLKSWTEQRAALSKRAEPLKLADNATPEQLGEWRKGLGLAEVAGDAQPEAYMAAYKVAPPEGYTMSDAEKGLVGGFAKYAYDKGLAPREVKAATDFFFQQQAAQQQALNKAAAEHRKASQHALRDELGSEQYEAMRAAGKAFLEAQIPDADARAAILLARMPDGGLLGDSRFFFDLVSKQALGAGYTDGIEANALEQGGRSIMDQMAEIESWQFKDRRRYDEAMKPGGRYDRLQNAAHTKGYIDDHGNRVRR